MSSDYLPRGLYVEELLQRAGFTWAEPGYWSLWIGDVVELTLQPQVMNAGDFQLQAYLDRIPALAVELLVDVKPRPAPDA